MGQTTSFEVKKVTTDDYAKVMAIREPEDIYNGKDYLRYSYHEMINSPHNAGFGAVINGQFVAFALATLINNRTTIVMRCVRVKKSYSGRGITRSLIQWIFRQFYLQLKIKRCWFTSKDTYAFNLIQNGELRFVTLRKSVVYQGKVESIIPGETRGKSDIQIIKAEKLDELFKDDKIRQHLFPSNCIVLFYDPYEPIADNIPFILTNESIILGSNINSKESMILSCGRWFKAKLNAYSISIYGNGHMTEDMNDHVIKHINICTQKLDGAVEIRICSDEHVDLTSIFDLLRKCNFRKFLHNYLLLVVEKDIKKYIRS